jgi:hypothetical protein
VIYIRTAMQGLPFDSFLQTEIPETGGTSVPHREIDDPSKAPGVLKSFEADPTIEGPPVPAKG